MVWWTGDEELMADPTTIGKYTVIRKIGQGGMGRVYAAKHPTLNRTIIIKQLLGAAKKMMTRRFLREASLMLDFHHDNIVPVYDHFKEGNSYFIAMEYVDGQSLEDLLNERAPLPPIVTLLIFREVCRGLAYAHAHGVIHRDIKPDNVLISNTGAVKLADFGIATAPEGDEGLTKTGVAMGTPAFMSPEQIQDAKNVDERSDIYSMGVMLYQMATGKRPFPGNFSAESIHKIVKGDYVRPAKLNRKIPRFLRRMIRRSMHHKKRRRYRDLYQIIHKLSRRLRPFSNPIKVNRAIESYLLSKDGGPTPKNLKMRRVAGYATVTVAGILLILAVSVASLHLGWYHELLQRRAYGAVEIVVTVPEDYFKRADRIYAFATVEQNDSEEGMPSLSREYQLSAPSRLAAIPYLSWFVLRSHPEVVEKGEQELVVAPELPEENEEETHVQILTTGRRYLPTGTYRIGVRVENKDFVESVYLMPREIQKRSLATRDGRRLELRFPDTDGKPIDVVHRIYDADTGESLSRDTVVYMQDEERWLNWDRYKMRFRPYLEERLRSGRTFNFRYELPGYYPRQVEAEVRPDSDAMDVRIDLLPKAGRLVIDSEAEGLSILINNREGDYLGKERRIYTRFGETVVGERSFDLPPGEYLLVLKKGARAETSYQLTITPDDVIQVNASYDEEARHIEIERSIEL